VSEFMKKTLRRLTAVMVTLIMTFTVLTATISSAASNYLELSLDFSDIYSKGSLAVGDEVYIPLIVTNAPAQTADNGINGADFTLSYDREYFEYIGLDGECYYGSCSVSPPYKYDDFGGQRFAISNGIDGGKAIPDVGTEIMCFIFKVVKAVDKAGFEFKFGNKDRPEGTYAFINTALNTVPVFMHTGILYPVLGDLNLSSVVDSVDASQALSIYANLAVNPNYIVDSKFIILGDVNFDGKLDSVDASKILTYYSYKAIGGTLTSNEYFAN